MRSAALIVLLTLASSARGSIPPPTTELVVGSDAFPTLESARDALRAGHGAGTRRVIRLTGDHHLTSTLTLDERDSGTPEAPVVWAGPARVTGGKPVPADAWEEATVPSGAPGVYVANLTRLGIANLGSGLGHPYPKNMLELFVGGAPATLARDPNIADDELRTWIWFGYENMTAVTSNFSFTFNDSDAGARWRAAALHEAETGGQLWLHGYFKFDWRDTFVALAGIEPTAGGDYNVTLDAKTPPQYALTKGCRFYAVGSLDLLDVPEEYYVTRSGLLYYYPESVSDLNDVVVSVLDNVIEATGMTNHVFEDLVLSTAQGSVLSLTGGANVTVRNCTVSNAGQSCLTLGGSTGSKVTGSTIFGCGSAAVAITGGDEASLTPANIGVVGNRIANFSRLRRTYTPGVSFSGVGFYVADNHISHGPHCAVQGGGSVNVFENNTIEHCSFECTDTGSFYVGRSWAQRGNVARFNRFHNIRATERLAQQSCSQNAFYLDDQMSGWDFHGNTITNSTTGVLLGGGRRNSIRNNTFRGNDKDIAFDNRGMNWMASAAQKNCTAGPMARSSCLRIALDAVDYTNASAPFPARFPEVLTIYEDHPGVPVHNVVTGNVYCHPDGKGIFIDRNASTVEAWHSVLADNKEQC